MDFGGFSNDRVGEEKGLLLDHTENEKEFGSDEFLELGSDEVLELNMTAQKIKHDDTISNAEESLSRVLRILNLNDKYPGKLTREDMYTITKSSLFDEKPKSHEDLAYYFIKKIAQYNYTAREFYIRRRENNISSIPKTGQGSTYRQQMKQRAEENKRLEVSPVDITIAVFLCCDDICRQDIVKHMWSCRLAVPLVIQEQTLSKPPSFYLWPLRSIVMQWETQIEGKGNVRECRLVNEPMKSIAFIRVGTNDLSKSALINSVISPTEKTHPIFFHRDSPGSTQHRYLVNGLVDISWYFPSPKSGTIVSNHFQEAVVFLNLHGDASKLQIHVKMISNLANIITILCAVKDLVPSGDIAKLCLDQGKAVLVVLTNREIKEDEENIIEYFIETLKPGENQLELLEIIDKPRADVIQETRNMLIKLSGGKLVSFNDVFLSDMYPDVDEKTDEFIRTMSEAKVLSNLISKTPYTERKSLFFPLQGDPWIKWAKADKEKLRNKYKEKNENLQSHIAKNERIMRECRFKQLEIVNQEKNRTFMDTFLNSANTPERERRLFLRWLHFEMDDLSRKDLQAAYDSYHKIMGQLVQAKHEERDTLKKKLKDLDDEVAMRSFRLEHVLREMGQMYEASYRPEFDLPGLAAEILLDGYPFELMDGYVNNVPLKWVVTVLERVENKLARRNGDKPVRMKTLSVLGIQSSGKSTMLNALFGCQYTVSAGRCTRGIYCQFVKVEERYRQELELDYILAIDTEGLKAPELSASGQMVHHDNELSAFVIGLADLTILNLMGENKTYLEELLPVTVHAFLRMDIATRLKPHCLIVHQTVNKEDEQKLLHQGRALEEMLDEMTKLACKVEKIDMRSFRDIISFNASTDLFYLSALHEGSPPMSPINTRYSSELNVLKRSMLVSTKDRTSKTLESFRNLLETLWLTIKKDDFVYEFRNTIETETRIILDDYWCKACYEFRQPIFDELSESYTKLQKCKNYEVLRKQIKSLHSQFKQQIITAHTEQMEAFVNFRKNYHDPIIKQTMLEWSVEMEKRFEDLSHSLSRQVSNKLEEYKDDKRREISILEEAVTYKEELMEYIKGLVSLMQSPDYILISETEKTNVFENNWANWKSRIVEKNRRTRTNIDIENYAYQAIINAFTPGVDALTTYLHNRSIESYTLEEFDANKIFRTFEKGTRLLDPSTKNEIINFANVMFDQIRKTLESRGRTIRPYTEGDIDKVITLVLCHYETKYTNFVLTPKDGVYLAVLACGYAIKELKKFHEAYESMYSSENLIENEKNHCLHIFKLLYSELDTANLLTAECYKIIHDGILEKITRTFASKVERKMRGTVVQQSKNALVQEILLELATTGDFNGFQRFIGTPEISISLHIEKLYDEYASRGDKPLEKIFVDMVDDIKGEVCEILSKSFQTSHESFMTWIETFQNEAGEIIVLKAVDRLQELAVMRKFDLKLFFTKISNCLQSMNQQLNCKHYIQQYHVEFRRQVVDSINNDVIGCTNSCPFCGAICDIAHATHTGNHYTKHHRPLGCRGNISKTTNRLIAQTCPENVASNKQFNKLIDDKDEWILYKEYKRKYPNWEINKDESGDISTFWNWFFCEYKNSLSNAYNAQLPEIPESWTLLTRETEIEKLRVALNK